MKTIVILISLTLCISARAQEAYTTFRSHLSFEYGIQIPEADMADRFGSGFTLGSQFEVLHIKSHLLAGVKGFLIFGNTVKEDVLDILRSPGGEIIGSDGGPADISLRERGFFVGPYIGRLFPLGENPCAGIKVQAGAGLVQHHVRIQDNTRIVPQLTGDYRKGYDKLSNGLAWYFFAGYQHLDPNKRINFLAGIDLTYGSTESRRDYDFNLMGKDTARRTDGLLGFRIGWILPITTGIPPETIYY